MKHYLRNSDKLVRLVVLTGLTLIAGWLRFSAANFGLPDQLRPDEEYLVPKALDFENDWNPHLAIYPAAQTYLVHGVLRSYALLSGAGRDLHSAYGSENGARAFLIARWTSAAMGSATVPIVYAACTPVFGPVAALAAAAIVTVSIIHVRESKFAKVEVPAGFWLALSIFMILRITVRGSPADYALAGLFCGLAAATHYTAGAISLGVLVAHLEARHREGKALLTSLADSRIYAAGFVAVLTFLCADPYFLLDWRQTVTDFISLRENYRMWNGGVSPAGYGWSWLLLRAMPTALGSGLEVFLLAAFPWVIFRPRPGTYSLLVFIAACFLSLTNGHPQLEFRYLVNPLIAMALLGGVLAGDLTVMACSWMGTRVGSVLALLAGMLLITPLLVRDVQLNQFLRRKDTRSIAREWMLAHVPRTDAVVLIGGETYGKPKLRGLYSHRVHAHTPDELARLTRWANWIVADSFPPLGLWSEGPSDAEVAELNSKGTLVFDLDPIKAGAPTPAFDPNDAFYVPFNQITSMTRPGPRIRIWKITTERATH